MKRKIRLMVKMKEFAIIASKIKNHRKGEKCRMIKKVLSKVLGTLH